MWYFAWILGVTAALAIGVINVMWFEFQSEFEAEVAASPHSGEAPPPPEASKRRS